MWPMYHLSASLQSLFAKPTTNYKAAKSITNIYWYATFCSILIILSSWSYCNTFQMITWHSFITCSHSCHTILNEFTISTVAVVPTYNTILSNGKPGPNVLSTVETRLIYPWSLSAEVGSCLYFSNIKYYYRIINSGGWGSVAHYLERFTTFGWNEKLGHK